jgi:hypothetical protein
MGWRQDDPGNALNSLQLIRDGAESRAEPRADKGERRYRSDRNQRGDQRIFNRGDAKPIV